MREITPQPSPDSSADSSIVLEDKGPPWLPRAEGGPGQTARGRAQNVIEKQKKEWKSNVAGVSPKPLRGREEVKLSRVEQCHTQVFGFTTRNWKGTLRKKTTTMTEKKTEKGALFSRGLVGAVIGTLTPF